MSDDTTTTTEPNDQDQTPDTPDTFPREYVEELRRENAEARIKAKRSDTLTARLVTALAEKTGRLADARDLPFGPHLLDDDGFPDPEKIGDAVDTLIRERPHLARRVVAGDVGQGARTDHVPAASLADLLRAGAS